MLRLDNQPALAALRRQVLGAGGMAAALMSAFAVAIAWTARAVRREREYAQARTRFTEMVSHELRTPLSAIAMYGEILREGLVEDPARVAAYHQQLAVQTERLKRLVEDVLSFARLEGSGAAPRLEPVGAAQVARRVAAAVDCCGARLDISGVPDELEVCTDPAMLEQILVNLVENATKHAGSHSLVELSAESRSGTVLFEVADRGPGVPEALRQRIFEPYARVQPDDGAKKDGVGLGLAVVNLLLKSLGGSVQCRPRPGGGSVFAVALPLQERR